MKKRVAALLSIIVILSLTACSNNDTPSADNAQPPSVADTSTSKPDDVKESDENKSEEVGSSSVSPEDQAERGNILIAYFTVPEIDGVDAVARASRVVVDGEVLGNTQFIAQIIQSEAGGDLFAIETVDAYPARPELMDRGADEQRQNARPELSTQIENLDDYDVIFLGYPNWNADLPMPLYTFLEQYDFTGKTIIPFCPHGGSGFSNTIKTIASLQPNATVITDGFTVSRDRVPDSENDVRNWVQNLNIAHNN